MKKSLSLLMVIAMLVCMMPAAAFAAGESDTGEFNWTSTSMSNFLGAGSSFVGLVFGDFKNVIDTEGKLAVGGNLQPAGGTTINAKNPRTEDTALIVGGNIVPNDQGGGYVHVLGGRGVIGGTISPQVSVEQHLPGGTKTGLDHMKVGNFFTEGKSAFIDLSSKYSALKQNAAITDNGYGKQIFNGVSASSKAVVYNTNISKFSETVFSIAEGQTVVINDTASEITFENGYFEINGTQDQNVLRSHSTAIIWNFPNATKININNKMVYGLVIAPNATVTPTGNGGSFNGTIICQNIYGNGGGFELHLGTGELKKSDIPELTKKVLERDDASGFNAWGDAADYDIGDDIPFELKGTTPIPAVFDTYKSYKYVFHDKISSGLTFNNDVTVSVLRGEEKAYTFAPGEYSINTSPSDGCSFDVSFNDLKASFGGGFKVQSGDCIVVNYTAKLNENAVVGGTGNPNEAYLEYSKTADGSGTGNTVKDKVVVFTFTVIANKVNADMEPLAGAGFTLFKNVKNESGEGTHYVTVGAITEGTTFTFKGLDAGTYKLVETKVPAGYNKAEDMEFKVVPVYNLNELRENSDPRLVELLIQNMQGEAISGDGKTFVINLASGEAITTIVNSTGAVLPETGGIGTKLFTSAGIMLILAAGVLLVTKRKMSVFKA